MQELFKKAEENLQKYWGFESFRSGQDKAVESVLEGKNTLILFPTGGGKSLCFQVPATVFDGLTLVISPLVALMQDQVEQLKIKGVSATFINSTIPNYEVEQRLVNARNGMYKLLYCAPERLSSELFQAELESLNIKIVAIDEAHCISEWGHDFRPAYRDIRSSLQSLPESTCWVALTASATPEVQQDILENLQFEAPNILTKGFERPNLKWWVVHTAKKREKLIESVEKASKKGDGLIYGGTRKNCEYWASYFSKKGLPCEPYHAGINAELRKQVQSRWIEGETPLVVATNAFGMGIDKSNCRYVIHDEMPYSLEAYYQEAGRAGRDGEEAFPILLYKKADFITAEKRLEKSYPTREEIEKVYQALCDSFHLAVGAFMEESRLLDWDNVVLRSRLSPSVCRSAIRLLNQFNVIALQDEVKAAFAIQFMLSREMLQKFKERCNNHEKAEFVDKLERMLGPNSFSDLVEVEEEIILKKLEVDRNTLVKALNVFMQNDQILVYHAMKERDVVKVIEARSSKLPLSKDQVEHHRKVLFSKLDMMNRFINTIGCREVFLRNYFGDTEALNCGHCDNCLEKESPKPQAEVTEDKISKVLEMIRREPMSTIEVNRDLGYSKEEIQFIFRLLVSEGKIQAFDEAPGYYSLSNESARF